MVLVAFVLVILAAVTFAAGIAASRTNDALVYVSIAFSLAAFVILAIASLRARQATRPVPEAEPVPPDRALDETEAHAGPLLGGLNDSQLDMRPTWRRRGERAVAVEPDEDEVEEQLDDEEDEADFEVPVITPELDWGRIEGDVDEEPTATFSLVFDDEEEREAEAEAELEDELEEEPALEAEDEVGEEEGSSFFVEYDDLTAAEILPLLPGLDADGLRWVRTRERGGAKRATVLNRVDELIAEQGRGRSAASKRPAAKKAAKKATTKTTTKTTTKATKKKAAPARRAAKKSTGRR